MVLVHLYSDCTWENKIFFFLKMSQRVMCKHCYIAAHESNSEENPFANEDLSS